MRRYFIFTNKLHTETVRCPNIFDFTDYASAIAQNRKPALLSPIFGLRLAGTTRRSS